MHDTVLTPLAQFWQHLDIFGLYAGLAMLFLIGLPMLSLSRALLMLWQSKRVAATGIWKEMLLQGVRVDVIQLSLLALPVLLLALVLILLAPLRCRCEPLAFLVPVQSRLDYAGNRRPRPARDRLTGFY